MRIVWRAGAVLVLSMVTTLLLAAQAPTPATPAARGPATPAHLSLIALGQLEPGLWQLDTKGQASKSVCVADGSELIQIAHDQSGCSRFVITNDPKASTVHYSCQGAGWGRTTVRIETARIAQIQTQGIAKNAPFDFVTQAKRVGACNATAEAHPR